MTATIHRIGRETSPSLDPLMSLVADEMNSVNAVILDRMQSRIPLIPELAGHLIAGGGPFIGSQGDPVRCLGFLSLPVSERTF